MKSPKTSKAPKRIGKHQRYSKNTKRFAAGGGTDDGELSLDNLSFGQAFNAVRQHMKDQGMDPNKQVFTWRGKKYSTAMAAPKPVAAEPVNARAEEVFRNLGYAPPKQSRAEDIGTIEATKPNPVLNAASRGLSAARKFMGKDLGGLLIGQSPEELDKISYGHSAFLDPRMTGVSGFGIQPSRARGFMDLAGIQAAGIGALEGAVAKAGSKAVPGMVNLVRGIESRAAGNAARADMIRASQELAAKRAAAAAKRAETIRRQKRLEEIAAEKETDAARQRLLDENEYYTQYAMKRGGKVSRKRGCK